MKAYLKIKIKSLAAEAKIIKAEERKFKPYPTGSIGRTIFWGLRAHRLKDVRGECRSASLAYGFLRGRPYLQIEKTCRQSPDWKRVEALATKYAHGADPSDLKHRFQEWKEGKIAGDKTAKAA